MKKGTVLDTPLVQIFEEDNQYKMLIKMSQGGILEHEPFAKNLQGLVSALQLATEILAGKFYPRRALTLGSEPSRLSIKGSHPDLLTERGNGDEA